MVTCKCTKVVLRYSGVLPNWYVPSSGDLSSTKFLYLFLCKASIFHPITHATPNTTILYAQIYARIYSTGKMTRVDFLLHESAVGYAIFKVVHQQDAVGLHLKEVQKAGQDLSKFGKMVQLVNFAPWRYDRL